MSERRRASPRFKCSVTAAGSKLDLEHTLHFETKAGYQITSINAPNISERSFQKAVALFTYQSQSYPARRPSLSMTQPAPEGTTWISEVLPGPQEKFAAFASAVFEDESSALDRKTKELIAAAVASVRRDRHTAAEHRQQARDAGASEAAVAEALAVAGAQGGGTQVFWMKDDFADLLGENWRRELIPDADRAFWSFKREVFDGDALPRATKELIAVAVSCALRCRHCTRSHIEAALDAGATRKEVAETLAVLWAVGSGAEFNWNRDDAEAHQRSEAHVAA